MLTFAERNVGDLAEVGAVVVQRADMPQFTSSGL